MFRFMFLFLLCSFAHSSVSSVVSSSVTFARDEFTAIISVVVPVVFFVVVSVAGVCFSLKLFRRFRDYDRGSNFNKRTQRYDKEWEWEGNKINTAQDFYSAWDKKYGGG